jgi:hypothetical protein
VTIPIVGPATWACRLSWLSWGECGRVSSAAEQKAATGPIVRATVNERLWTTIWPEYFSHGGLPPLSQTKEDAEASVSKSDIIRALLPTSLPEPYIELKAKIRDIIQGTRKAILEVTYRVLRSPVRFKKFQTRIAKSLRLDLHAGQWKYLNMIKEQLDSGSFAPERTVLVEVDGVYQDWRTLSRLAKMSYQS